MLWDQIYIEYKPMMFGLAYRMLGSAADAEDIVQDVFSQFVQMDRGEVRSEKAYLAKMTTNRCINLLKSSRRQRETYTGPWLPEPMPDYDMIKRSDPAERRENIGYAYLVLLQRLTPLERAIYIAKDTLGLEYHEISEMLGKTEISCRKTFSRAKQKWATIRRSRWEKGPGRKSRNASLKPSCGRPIWAILNRCCLS